MPIRLTDDYLTARAANPRTGQISPSTAGTPKASGNAAHTLNAGKLNVQASPTPQHVPGVQSERKLCGIGTKSAQSMWLRDGSSWLQDTRALKMASPVMTGPRSEADLLDASSHPGFNDDQFVVKMPSAREPQPYKFPGSSGAQIKAFEHYKHKAKRTSVQGYDPRLIDLYHHEPREHQPMSRKLRAPHPENSFTSHIPHTPSENFNHIQPECMPKQRSRVVHDDPSPFMQPDIWKVTAEPMARSPSIESNATTIRHPSQAGRSTFTASPIASPDIPLNIESRRMSNESNGSTTTVVTGRANTALGRLPRVRLIHPSLASKPITQNVPSSRQCSLGCDKFADGNVCVAVDRDITPVKGPNLRAMLETKTSAVDQIETPNMVAFLESIAVACAILWQVLQDGIISHEQALHRLFPQHLTLWEKLLIAKSLMVLVIKAVACFLIVAIMWKIADVALQLVRFLFMPLRFLTGFSR